MYSSNTDKLFFPLIFNSLVLSPRNPSYKYRDKAWENNLILFYTLFQRYYTISSNFEFGSLIWEREKKKVSLRSYFYGRVIKMEISWEEEYAYCEYNTVVEISTWIDFARWIYNRYKQVHL